MRLSEFTPAETLLLTKGSNVLLKDLLKYTFMDLLLRKVLLLTRKKYQPDARSKGVTMKYISAGTAFNSYQALSHEQVFTSPFLQGKRNIQFRFMIKMAVEQAAKFSDYDPLILESSSINKFVKKNIFHRVFGGYTWTSEGKDLGELLKKELQLLDKDLPLWMKQDQKKALEVFTSIKGNVFLLKNVDFQLLRNFDKEVIELQRTLSESNDWGGYGMISLDSSWISDSHHSSSWDTSFDSSWDSVSGCSSDSGCSSGCSGCGGCGGGD